MMTCITSVKPVLTRLPCMHTKALTILQQSGMSKALLLCTTHLPPSHESVQHAVAGQEHEHPIRHNLAHGNHALPHAVLERSSVCMLVGCLQQGAIGTVTDGPCPHLLLDIHHVRSLQLDWECRAQLHDSQDAVEEPAPQGRGGAEEDREGDVGRVVQAMRAGTAGKEQF